MDLLTGIILMDLTVFVAYESGSWSPTTSTTKLRQNLSTANKIVPSNPFSSERKINLDKFNWDYVSNVFVK